MMRVTDKRKLGKSGVEVPVIGFGGAPLGNLYTEFSDEDARADHGRTRALRRRHDLLGGHVERAVIKGLEPDPNILLHHRLNFLGPLKRNAPRRSPSGRASKSAPLRTERWLG